MEVVVGILAVTVLALCGASVLWMAWEERHARERQSAPDSCKKRKGEQQTALTDAAVREREKEAFYMRNFWSYDGSEQEEFDE